MRKRFDGRPFEHNDFSPTRRSAATQRAGSRRNRWRTTPPGPPDKENSRRETATLTRTSTFNHNLDDGLSRDKYCHHKATDERSSKMTAAICRFKNVLPNLQQVTPI